MGSIFHVKDIKNTILGLIIFVFLLWALHFVLSAGVSLVDKNGCLRPAYTCKKKSYLDEDYKAFVYDKLQNDQTCKQKYTNYLQAADNIRLKISSCDNDDDVKVT